MMNCKSKKIKNPALAFSAANNPSTRFSEEDQYQLPKGFSSKKKEEKTNTNATTLPITSPHPSLPSQFVVLHCTHF
jgi:hypothetical protein